MCRFATDLRYDSFIEGMTRYQWPRIIAVQVPPRSAADVRKLAIVSAVVVADHPDVTSIACSTNVRIPPAHATPTMAGRMDASIRPTVAQYSTTAASVTTSDPNARRVTVVVSPPGLKAKATAIRMAARPALNRKNFTPASRDTSARVKTIPIARWVRKRKRTNQRSRLLI